jgi:glycosyltransferase 2 family protein
MGIGLLYLAYRDIDLDELWGHIKQANFFFVGLSFVMGYLAIVSRGMRWNLLLEPLNFKAHTWNCIHAVSFGYFANTFVPRSGEVARCVALYQTDDVPVDRLFGTVIMERIVDSCMLLIFLLIAFFTHLDAFGILMENASFGDGSGTLKLLSLIGGLGGVFLVLFLIFRKKLMKNAIVQKIVSFLKGMKDGLQSVFKMKKRMLFLGHTFFIWGMYYLMAYAIFFAIPETAHLSMLNGLFIVVAGGLGMVFPSPGGTGSYQYAVKLGFVALGLSEVTGVIFGTIVWATQTLMILSTGIVAAIGLFLARKRKAALIETKNA